MRTVFLSSTARDLSAFRDAAYKAIEGLDGFHCVRMEDFGARAAKPEAYCLDTITNCDVTVFLVGLCHGSAPEGSATSYTELEYDEAVRSDVPQLIFLSKEGEEYPGFYKESHDQWVAQQKFRKRVNSDAVRADFNTPDKLAAAVTQAMANWATENFERELSGSTPTFNATLKGSSALAQQGGVAAGGGGIAIGGNLEGDIISSGGKKEVHIHSCLLSENQTITDLISKEVESKLESILQRRIFDLELPRKEIAMLLAQFGLDGDLFHVSRKLHIDVLMWASRLNASQKETLDEAISYREQIRLLEPAADTRIVDSWIMANQGEVDAALVNIRDINTPDGRSNVFAILRKFRSPAEALEWWQKQPWHEAPVHLTGIGCYIVAVTLASNGQWDEAINYLVAAKEHFENFPALAFLEGLLNSTMLLPIQLRQGSLNTPPYLIEVATVEGADADTYRAKALTSFTLAIHSLEPIGLHKEMQQARLMIFWLRLTDPNQEVAEATRREVTENASDCEQCIRLLPLIRRFKIPFDATKVSHYLDTRKKLGGLGPEETFAEFMLALITLQPAEMAEFLEREEQRFSTVVPRILLKGRRIEALAADGQITQAMALLESCRQEFNELDVSRLQTLIKLNAGEDVRERAYELYRCSNDKWTDLHNLTNLLWQYGDWGALRPLLEDLYRYEQTLENATRLVHCLSKLPNPDTHAIVSFLEINQGMVARSHDLASAQAWALFQIGRWKEADTITKHLLQERFSPTDLYLDTNLALQTGDWERFSAIVDREWDRRDKHDSTTLLRLATLAAESDITQKRAIELVQMAAKKAPDDPDILVSACSLAFQMGLEDEIDLRWLTHAAEKTADTGPVWSVSFRKIVEEIIPAQRERSSKVEDAFTRGEIPVHFAADAINRPLSSLLLDLPQRNREELDGRKRFVIPLFSGARSPLDINTEWTVGFDVTAILVLHYLDLLELVLETVHGAALAPDTMLFLLRERRQVRFHQPSRVKKAEEIQGMIGRRLQADDLLPEPPTWLVDEVGMNLAQLLESAKLSGGRVVHPHPVHKLRSFMEEKAELQEYAPLVISTVVFARLLKDNGFIDLATYERACGFLRIRDQDQDFEIDSELWAHPVYLDELSITYFQDAGLLQPLCRSELNIRVHFSLLQDQKNLIEANRHGENLAESLDKIRCILRDALETGKAFFLPHQNLGADQDREENWLKASAVATFLKDSMPCDAICFDDRSLNRNPLLIDGNGRQIPVLCTLDMLRFLETNEKITATQREEKLHRLREGCFGFVPLSANELEHRLDNVQVNVRGHLQENLELRSIRQTLMRIRSIDILQQPIETPYLDRLRIECLQFLCRLWKSANHSPDYKVAVSDWVWCNVSPSPLDWWRTAQGKSGLRPLPEAFGNHLAMLLIAGSVTLDAHQDNFRNWVEESVVTPLLPGNSNLMIECLPLLKNTIKDSINCLATPIEKALMGKILCNQQPTPIRQLLLQDQGFCDEIGLKLSNVLTFGNIVHINEGTLYKSARSLLTTRSNQALSDVEGHTITLSLINNTVALENLPGQDEPWTTEFPELLLFSPQRNERMRAMEDLSQILGPTSPDFSIEMANASLRELSEDEVKSLLTEQLSGVASVQAKIHISLKHKENIQLEDLIPQEFNYYERYCGPDPIDESPEEYLRNHLPNYRKLLLSRNLSVALDICLDGALRDDLFPGGWIEQEPNDVVWSSLEKCAYATNPFGLLGALDIALLRQVDNRFRVLAEKLIEKLLQDTLPRPDGNDSYQMMSVLAELILNSLNSTKDGARRPPFWKRMSAWMHAGFLQRAFIPYNFDLPEFANWINSQITVSGEYGKILDLRREPMYLATDMSAKTLRQEVLGRLISLRTRHESCGRIVPRGSEIEKVIEISQTVPLKVHWNFPGPLEGHQRPAEIGNRAIPEAEASEIAAKLGDDPCGPLFPVLAKLSQQFDLSGILLDRAREVADKGFPLNSSLEKNEVLVRFGNGCLPAAAQRDVLLAKALGNAVLFTSSQAHTMQEIQAILRLLLHAGAAFEKKEEWTDWIETQLLHLAINIPKGEPSKHFLYILGELKKVIDLTDCIHCRAEACASAAIGR